MLVVQGFAGVLLQVQAGDADLLRAAIRQLDLDVFRLNCRALSASTDGMPMVFSSHLFLFYFLPLALIGQFALLRAPQRWSNLWLALTGYVFYGWAEPRFWF